MLPLLLAAQVVEVEEAVPLILLPGPMFTEIFPVHPFTSVKTKLFGPGARLKNILLAWGVPPFTEKLYGPVPAVGVIVT